MLAVSLWCKNRDGVMETQTFLCESFEKDYRDGDFKIHFSNGTMSIESDAFDGFIVYQHSFGETDILYPLNPARMSKDVYDDDPLAVLDDLDDDYTPSLEEISNWLDKLEARD